MIMDFWRSLIGSVPAGFEAVEYALAASAVLMVIILFFRFLITFVRILFSFISK